MCEVYPAAVAFMLAEKFPPEDAPAPYIPLQTRVRVPRSENHVQIDGTDKKK